VDKAPTNGDVLYSAGYVYGLAAEAVRRDRTLDASTRDRLAGQDTAEAFALLGGRKRPALSPPRMGVGGLKTDKLLDRLRSGEPFKKLLADIEKAGPVPR
jgi:hypothetical protein